MEDTFQQVFIPLQQAIILFHGYEILAVRLPDNRIAAVLNSLCAMFGIRPHGQAQRIRRRKGLTQHLLLALVETPGGPQRMDVLVAEAIPFWALGVQVEQLAPEKRPLVVTIQMEIVAYLYRHFFAEGVAEPASEPQAVPPPRIVPDRSNAASDSPWDRLFDALHDLRQDAEQQAHAHRALAGRVVVVEEWLTSLDRQVAAAGQGGAVESGWLPAFSAAHQADLRTLFRLLAETTGRLPAQLEQELAATFGVAAITAIPDEQWPDVLAWCWWRAQQPG